MLARSRDEIAPAWVAIANGALDVRDVEGVAADVELLVLPTEPGPPLGLVGPGANLWRRLTHEGPLADGTLSEDDAIVVRQMAECGLASTDPGHPARCESVPVPWLSSPIHELVYALSGRVAKELGIDLAVIKGPALHAQGLRERAHSGDVDLWLRPADIPAFCRAMEPWGWVELPEVWGEAPINHSVTLDPRGDWGCQVDVHRRMPGLALPDDDALRSVLATSEPMAFAGVPVQVPSTTTNAVLSAVHTLRPEIGRQVSDATIDVAAEILRRGDQGVVDAAVSIDALRALRVALTRAFPEQAIDFSAAGHPRDWVWRGQPNKVRAYLSALRELPWRSRPSVLWRLVWPTREAARESDVRAGGSPVGGATRLRLRRLTRGVRALFPRRR